MYKEIGKKIKALAQFIFWFQAICMLLCGIALIAINERTAIIGVLVLVLGPVMAWLSMFLLYGYGELVDKTCSIEARLCEKNEIIDEKAEVEI